MSNHGECEPTCTFLNEPLLSKIFRFLSIEIIISKRLFVTSKCFLNSCLKSFSKRGVLLQLAEIGHENEIKEVFFTEVRSFSDQNGVNLYYLKELICCEKLMVKFINIGSFNLHGNKEVMYILETSYENNFINVLGMKKIQVLTSKYISKRMLLKMFIDYCALLYSSKGHGHRHEIIDFFLKVINLSSVSFDDLCTILKAFISSFDELRDENTDLIVKERVNIYYKCLDHFVLNSHFDICNIGTKDTNVEEMSFILKMSILERNEFAAHYIMSYKYVRNMLQLGGAGILETFSVGDYNTPKWNGKCMENFFRIFVNYCKSNAIAIDILGKFINKGEAWIPYIVMIWDRMENGRWLSSKIMNKIFLKCFDICKCHSLGMGGSEILEMILRTMKINPFKEDNGNAMLEKCCELNCWRCISVLMKDKRIKEYKKMKLFTLCVHYQSNECFDFLLSELRLSKRYLEEVFMICCSQKIQIPSKIEECEKNIHDKYAHDNGDCGNLTSLKKLCKYHALEDMTCLNKGLIAASKNGFISIVRCLLSNIFTDPKINEYLSLVESIRNRHTWVFRDLLNDKRINIFKLLKRNAWTSIVFDLFKYGFEDVLYYVSSKIGIRKLEEYAILKRKEEKYEKESNGNELILKVRSAGSREGHNLICECKCKVKELKRLLKVHYTYKYSLLNYGNDIDPEELRGKCISKEERNIRENQLEIVRKQMRCNKEREESLIEKEKGELLIRVERIRNNIEKSLGNLRMWECLKLKGKPKGNSQNRGNVWKVNSLLSHLREGELIVTVMEKISKKEISEIMDIERSLLKLCVILEEIVDSKAEVEYVYISCMIKLLRKSERIYGFENVENEMKQIDMFYESKRRKIKNEVEETLKFFKYNKMKKILKEHEFIYEERKKLKEKSMKQRKLSLENYLFFREGEPVGDEEVLENGKIEVFDLHNESILYWSLEINVKDRLELTSFSSHLKKFVGFDESIIQRKENSSKKRLKHGVFASGNFVVEDNKKIAKVLKCEEWNTNFEKENIVVNMINHTFGNVVINFDTPNLLYLSKYMFS